eukprot:scaffold11583_cov79-Isochrysis_galbana.AAC.1
MDELNADLDSLDPEVTRLTPDHHASTPPRMHVRTRVARPSLLTQPNLAQAFDHPPSQPPSAGGLPDP